jgi:PAS domain S-box-containing protein
VAAPHRAGRGWFSAVATCAAGWAFFAAVELLADSVELKTLLSKLQYIFVVFLAPIWFRFSLSYVPGVPGPRRRGMEHAIWLIPSLVLLLAWSNEQHGLVWASVQIGAAAPGELLRLSVYDHGPAVWGLALYSYVLLAIGSLRILRAAIASGRRRYRQGLALAAGALIPWLGNLAYLSRAGPVDGLDLTPVAILFSGFCFVWVFRQQNLFAVTTEELAEREIRRRDHILEAVRLAAADWLRRADWRETIGENLRRLGEATGADRAYIFENVREEGGRLCAAQRHEWVAPDITPQIENPQLNQVPYEKGLDRWYAALSDGQPIKGRVRDFPLFERNLLLRDQGIQSIAVVPIFAGSSWWGFLGFDHGREEHPWSEAEMDALRTAAETLGAALEGERTTRALRERVREQARLVTAIEQADETAVITDQHGRIEYVNPAFERITGYTREEVVGRTPGVLKSGKHPPEFYAELWSQLREGKTWRGLFWNRRKDGSLYEEEASISPVFDAEGRVANYVAIKRDITRQRALEAQLRQAQKMESIGRLAGGVAHDFNNSLQAILGFCELLLAGKAADDPERSDLEFIHKSAKHASELTAQLLAFSRRQIIRPQTIGLNELVREQERMLRRVLGETILLAVVCDPADPPVRADVGQIRQVLVNLAVNARDAMPAGGTLTLRTRAHDEPGADGAPGSRWVCIDVSDTGTGMSEEVQAHLFEPFFTTKPLGQGTGLGLSVVDGIVKQHGGRVEVKSAPGEGTCFTVFLPRVACEEDAEGAAAADTRAAPPPSMGRRVLLVEDEEGPRRFSVRVLREHGFDIEEATDLAAARARSEAGPFDLLVSDVILPDGSGAEFARDWAERHPGGRVVLMSGYAQDRIQADDFKRRGFVFLAKPVSVQALLEAVRGTPAP